MDKLKQIFSPGSSKDDEILYGDAEQRRQGNIEDAPPTVSPNARLETDPGQKEHSVLRQLLNPGGEKYDEVAYGKTAHTVGDKDLSTHPSDSTANVDHSNTSQTINPSQEKYDPVAHGTSHSDSVPRDDAAPVGEAAATSTVADKSVEPSRDIGTGSSNVASTTQPTGQNLSEPTSQTTVPDDSHFERDAAVAGGATAAGAGAYAVQQHNNESLKEDPAQTQPSQTTTTSTTNTTTSKPSYDDSSKPTTYPTAETTSPGDSNLGRDAALVGGVGAAGSSQPVDEKSSVVSPSTSNVQPISHGTTDESHLGRDAALAGGLGAAGAGTYAATRGNNDTEGSITDRPHPLSSKADQTSQSDTLGSGPLDSEPTAGSYHTGASTDAHTNPIGAPEERFPTSTGSTGVGHDATLFGGVTAAGASSQLNTAPADVQNATYTDRSVPVGGGFHHTHGPHPTDIANILDPHVPGEFPSESGVDKHDLGDPLARNRDYEPFESTSGTTHDVGESQPAQATTSTLPSAPENAQDTLSTTADDKVGEHHYGRDAAVAGGTLGAGAAGYGAYEATKDRDATDSTQQSLGTDPRPAETTSHTTQSAPISNAEPEVSGAGDHHYGRDAAIVGGTGATGYGIYEATKDHHGAADTSRSNEPISQSVDPVSTTTQSSTTTNVPTQSDNKSAIDSTTQQLPDKSANREAAVIGGTGAAGYGAYEASQARDDTGPASKTIGPHESNIANIMDPRVQPEPEKMKGSKTTETHSSDHADKADSRVKSDLAQSHDQDRSRDAALAGGAGAVGAAAGTTALASSTDDSASQDPSTMPARNSLEEEIRKTAARRTGNPEAAAVYAHERAGESNEPRIQITGKQEAEKSSDKGEKKPSLLHRILHPGHKSEDKEAHKSEKEAHKSVDPKSLEEDNRVSTDDHGHHKLHKKAVDQSETSGDGTIIEPHTGLPMNVGKYGTGAGGTDGAPQIEGYHGPDPTVGQTSTGTAENVGSGQSHVPGEQGVAGPDWDAIKKANTPY